LKTLTATIVDPPPPMWDLRVSPRPTSDQQTRLRRWLARD
jgi:hypothetical protein